VPVLALPVADVVRVSFKLCDFLRECELVTPPTKTTIKVNKDKSITVGAMVHSLFTPHYSKISPRNAAVSERMNPVMLKNHAPLELLSKCKTILL